MNFIFIHGTYSQKELQIFIFINRKKSNKVQCVWIFQLSNWQLRTGITNDIKLSTTPDN
jgi:hypothetical protein